eukprot:UN02248
MAQPQDGEHMMGTTIMAVSFDGGVVMGADSRTSTGSYVANRVSDKITQIADNIFCCRSGSAADTQAISDYVRAYLNSHSIENNGAQSRVKTAAKLFQTICYENKDRLLAGIICAGYDDVDGGSVYSINLGGSCAKHPYTISGSGSGFIYGFCDANFKENMTRDECIEFTKKAVAHAMARDGSSGGVIRLTIIDKNGFERQFIPGDELPYKLW